MRQVQVIWALARLLSNGLNAQRHACYLSLWLLSPVLDFSEDPVAVDLTWGWISCLFATGARAMCDCLLGPRSSSALTSRRRHSGAYLIEFCTHFRLLLSRLCNAEVTPNANRTDVPERSFRRQTVQVCSTAIATASILSTVLKAFKKALCDVVSAADSAARLDATAGGIKSH